MTFSASYSRSLNFELHSCAYQLRNTVSESIKVFIHNNEKGGRAGEGEGMSGGGDLPYTFLPASASS